MADLFVKNTGSNTAPYSDWATAATTLATAMAAAAAGDTVYVASTHTESQATAMSLTNNGTLAAPVRILSVTEATPPTTVTPGASITTTAGGSFSLPASFIVDGVYLDIGTATSSAAINLATSVTANHNLVVRNARWRLNSSNSTNRIQTGSASSNAVGVKALFENCVFRFTHPSASLSSNGGENRYIGCSIESGGAATTTIYRAQTGNQKSQAFFDGCDFTNAATTVTLANTLGSGASATFKNCKLPASWTGTLASGLSAGARVSMYNCDSGDTNYRMQIAEYHGDIYSDTAIYRTGGASDGTTPLSWRMVTNANAVKDALVLMSDEIVVWNDTTGSARTLTIEIAQEGGTALKDDEIWVEVQYLGAANTLGSIVNDRKTNLLAAGVDQTTSTVAWTGFTSPTKQKLSVTFTPGKAGPIYARVYLAKPSTTVYVCPKAEIT